MDEKLATIHRLEQSYEAIGSLLERLGDDRAAINRGVPGREVALTITKVEEARMWLGQAILVARAERGE